MNPFSNYIGKLWIKKKNKFFANTKVQSDFQWSEGEERYDKFYDNMLAGGDEAYCASPTGRHGHRAFISSPEADAVSFHSIPMGLTCHLSRAGSVVIKVEF